MHSLSRRLLVAGMAGMAARGRALAEGNNRAPAAAAPAPLTIGAMLPLSGDLSLVGDECLRGIQLAVDAMNAAGGIAGALLNLITGDAYDQSAAGAAAQGLINNQAALLLGSGASAVSYSGSAAAELAQLPYIELNAPADGIMTRGFKFLLRSGITTTMTANLAIDTINKKFAGKTIGLLFNTGAAGGAIAAAALSAWNAAKITPLLSIGYPADQVDLSEPVGRMKRAGVQVVLHAADPGDVLVFYAAMQNAGWKPAAIIGCGDGYLLRESAYALGDAFDKTLVVGAPFYAARAQYLAEAYMARFAMPPRSADSLTCFVGAKLVFDKLAQVGGDFTKVLDALRRTDIPNGTLANGWGVAFDKTGQNTRSFPALQQWRGGALTQI
jgi:branched-chain amino acid transport system substrate-binding protein